MQNSQFELHETPSGRKKSSFKINICAHMRGLMERINPYHPKHAEFLSMTQFGFDIVFDEFNYKNSYEEIKEAAQAIFLEDMSNSGMLEFLERSNDVVKV